MLIEDTRLSGPSIRARFGITVKRVDRDVYAVSLKAVIGSLNIEYCEFKMSFTDSAREGKRKSNITLLRF